MKKLLIVCLVIFCFTGCSTISRVTHLKGQPPVTELFPDDEDIAEVIEDIKAKPPVKSKIKYTPQGYLIPPDIYEKILNDKIYLMALKAKVKAFAADYDPETLNDAMRKDAGTMAITILLIMGLTLY